MIAAVSSARNDDDDDSDEDKIDESEEAGFAKVSSGSPLPVPLPSSPLHAPISPAMPAYTLWNLFVKVEKRLRTTGGGATGSVRNLRIREDTAKYLLNLDVNSAHYDPKTRSMRADPLPHKVIPAPFQFIGPLCFLPC